MNPSDRFTRAAKVVAAAAAVGVLAFGAKAIAGGGSPSSADVAGTARAPVMPGRDAGGPPGFGSAVTGATLDRLEAAVSARYPGTVERADKLPDGSYVVHVIRSDNTEVHVLVGKHFKVTGVEQGGYGRPGGDHAPSGSSSGTSATES